MGRSVKFKKNGFNDDDSMAVFFVGLNKDK